MAFELPKRKYDKDALEPHIDAKTMDIHYNKHHKGYTDKLNKAIEGTDLDGKTIENILENLGTFILFKTLKSFLSYKSVILS